VRLFIACQRCLLSCTLETFGCRVNCYPGLARFGEEFCHFVSCLSAFCQPTPTVGGVYPHISTQQQNQQPSSSSSSTFLHVLIYIIRYIPTEQVGAEYCLQMFVFCGDTTQLVFSLHTAVLQSMVSELLPEFVQLVARKLKEGARRIPFLKFHY
jgi:hypothetical protein